MRKYKFVLLGFCMVALLAATGFLREFLFVNINEQLSFLWYGHEVSNMSSKLSFLAGFDYWTMYYLKWFLTGFFSILFLLESAITMKVILGYTHLKELIFLYALLILISTVLFVGYGIAGMNEDGYLLSRFFMGLAQSPVPLMILFPAILLRKRGALK